ncbi:MAG: DUF4835 family protein [Bacteroidota bacterium]
MKAWKYWALALMMGWSSSLLQAQELLVNVSIDASRIQSDKSIFDDMQKSISEYFNFQSWSGDEYLAHERIRCNLQIIVSQRPSPDYFVAKINLQVYRPVYGTSYETMVLNLSDSKFNFTYVPFQQMTFVDNTYNDNLTSLLNYYAYLILGFDYDTFSPGGGTRFFQKAREIVNLAGSASGESGWRSNEDDRNRYWIVENILNSRYRAYHDVLYKYHRQGLDRMDQQPAQARRAIIDALKELERIQQQNPRLVLTRLFLDSKSGELVKAFSKAFANDKQEFISVMEKVDPSNISTYEAVMKTK